jgi:hypothetical protein
MAKPTNRFVRVAQIAYELSKKTLPLYAHLKSPHHYTLPQLNACVLLMFYLDFSYRDMELWLDATESICAVLELTKIPSYSTLCRAVHRWRKAGLDALQRTLLDELNVQEEIIAVDTTGYRPTQASVHYLARSGRTYAHFIKGGYAVGAHSLLILGSRYGVGPGADTAFLEPLRRQAQRYGQTHNGQATWLLLGDAGLDGVTARASDLIPPIRRGGRAPRGTRAARGELVAAARLAGVFGQRWKCETVHSVIKRKFGDTIRARKACHRRCEPLVKGLIYNIHVL